jgi:ribosome biogenesis GTPase A
MNLNYNSGHRLIACVLLLSLFLQGCNNSFIPPTSSDKSENIPISLSDKPMTQASTNPNQRIINQLVDKTFTVGEGYTVTFHEQNGEVRADIRVDETQPKPNYRNLPVRIDKDVEGTPERYIHVKKLQNGKLGSVEVHRGLMGGMRRQGGNTDKGKEKVAGYEEEKEEKPKQGNKGKEKEEAEIKDEDGGSSKDSQAKYKIKELQDFIKEAARNAEKAKGKDIVLVLGNTDAGKSTIINYLLGSELEEAENELGDVIVKTKDPQKEWAKIGHTLNSQTFLPSVYVSEDCPFVYCDCPGFNDSRTEEKRLNTTIATQLIINAAEHIRAIIVIIDVADLTHRKGEGMKDISIILSRLFKENMEPNSFLFVFNNKTGRNMKLSNIHLKVAALEKSETEKEEKLAKMQEKEGNKGSQKEYETSSQILSMLKMISTNKKNTFLIDLFDEFESKATIEGMLVDLQATHKNCFDFSSYDKIRIEFNKQLKKVVDDLSNKMNDLCQATQNISINDNKIESCEERTPFYKSRIATLNPEQKMENEEKIQFLKDDLHKLYTKFDKLKHEKASKEFNRGELLSRRDRLLIGWDEEIFYYSKKCDSNGKVGYNGVPFTKVELKLPDLQCYNYYSRDECGRHFREPKYRELKTSQLFPIQRRTENKLKGECQIYFGFNKDYFWEISNDFPSPGPRGGFNICGSVHLYSSGNIPITYEFQCPSKSVDTTHREIKSKCIENVLCKLSCMHIYIKKKDHPENKALLEQIEKELAQCEALIKEYDKEIEEIQRACKNTEALIARYKEDVEAQRKRITDWKRYLEGELARIEREKVAARSNNKEQQRIKEEAESYLTERGQLIAGVNTLISHGVVEESKLIGIEKFKKYHQHYSTLLEQGPDYLLPFSEEDLPTYLLCPLRSDIFIDPVITSCGHTFSQHELLMWLSRNKTCPECRRPEVENEVKPNLRIRQAIEEFEKRKDN